MPYPAGLSENQLVTTSLLNYLKDIILVKNKYYTIQTSDPLSLVTGTTYTYSGKNADWIYYNPDSSSLTDLTVPPTIAGGTVDYIDYYRGRVTFTATPTSPTATYNAHTVKVQPAFPEYTFTSAAQLPVLALDYLGKDREDLMIGSAGKWLRRRYVLDIWARNAIERDNLMDRVEEQLKHQIPIYDYNTTGEPLSYDGTTYGTINTSFNRDVVFFYAKVKDLRTQIVRIPTGSALERNRAQISFIMESTRAQ